MLRRTVSLCPVCHKRIPADLVGEDGKLVMKKSCDEHGEFEDIVFSDVSVWKDFMKDFHTGNGVKVPITHRTARECPFDCGLCNEHKSSTVLALMDVTNRCNMHCPICFANANDQGYVYEPTMEQIRKMYQVLVDERPRCYSLMMAGGEPTVRNDLPEIVRVAKEEYGFKEILIASNAVRFSRDYEFTKELAKAGASTIYMQFDGLTPKPYMVARGFNAFPIKVKAIENLRKVRKDIGYGPNIVLVPVLVKGVNDDQIGDLIRFAAKNKDIVAGVNFQPVSFTGRINRKKLKEQRFTVTDLFHKMEEQTDGAIKVEDWVSVPALVPILEYLRVSRNPDDYPELSIHPVCGSGVYVIVGDNGELTPLNRILDVKKLLELFKEGKIKSKKDFLLHLPKLIKLRNIGKAKPLMGAIEKIFTEGSYRAAAEFHKHVLFIGDMHFQDGYDFDEERIQRCGIHYVIPDGRLIPFCSYNLIHRPLVEKEFSRPIKDSEKWEGLLKPTD
ncbi:MAG: radical SAM protein [Candidatus Diapherotrites archaeon]|nr:radical SAM protein [Candidatus Diapherotrites archaeon]